jgi:hypothetical protein
MNRREELRARRAELAAEIPELANLLEDKLAEYEGIHRELEALDQQRRHLRLIEGGKKVGAILAPILPLRWLPKQRIALAAASTAAVGGTLTLAAVTFAAPASMHARAGGYPRGVGAPAPTGVTTTTVSRIRQPAPSPSSTLSVSASTAATAAPPTPPAAASTLIQPTGPAETLGGILLTVSLPAVPSPSTLPTTLPSLPPPSLPVTLPSPSSSATCLLRLNLPPVVGACVL